MFRQEQSTNFYKVVAFGFIYLPFKYFFLLLSSEIGYLTATSGTKVYDPQQIADK